MISLSSPGAAIYQDNVADLQVGGTGPRAGTPHAAAAALWGCPVGWALQHRPQLPLPPSPTPPPQLYCGSLTALAQMSYSTPDQVAAVNDVMTSPTAVSSYFGSSSPNAWVTTYGATTVSITGVTGTPPAAIKPPSPPPNLIALTPAGQPFPPGVQFPPPAPPMRELVHGLPPFPYAPDYVSPPSPPPNLIALTPEGMPFPPGVQFPPPSPPDLAALTPEGMPFPPGVQFPPPSPPDLAALTPDGMPFPPGVQLSPPPAPGSSGEQEGEQEGSAPGIAVWQQCGGKGGSCWGAGACIDGFYPGVAWRSALVAGPGEQLSCTGGWLHFPAAPLGGRQLWRMKQQGPALTPPRPAHGTAMQARAATPDRPVCAKTSGTTSACRPSRAWAQARARAAALPGGASVAAGAATAPATRVKTRPTPVSGGGWSSGHEWLLWQLHGALAAGAMPARLALPACPDRSTCCALLQRAALLAVAA
jgi:hypothetical protein